MDPTLDGYILFIRNIMGVPVTELPDDSPYIQFSYDWGLNICYYLLSVVPSQPTSPSIYAVAVYNCAADGLVNIVQDIPPSTYWSDIRTKLGINAFVAGLINTTGDQGTWGGVTVPEQLKNLTFMDLQQSKTPWGRTYLAIAGGAGTHWGMS
jgi:hypothetical protein